MALTLAQLVNALRLPSDAASLTDERGMEIARLQGVAITIINDFAPHAPDNVKDESTVRLVGHLFEVGPGSGRMLYQNAITQSGAASLLDQYRQRSATIITRGEETTQSMQSPDGGGASTAEIDRRIGLHDDSAQAHGSVESMLAAHLRDHPAAPGQGLSSDAVNRRIQQHADDSDAHHTPPDISGLATDAELQLHENDANEHFPHPHDPRAHDHTYSDISDPPVIPPAPDLSGLVTDQELRSHENNAEHHTQSEIEQIIDEEYIAILAQRGVPDNANRGKPVIIDANERLRLNIGEFPEGSGDNAGALETHVLSPNKRVNNINRRAVGIATWTLAEIQAVDAGFTAPTGDFLLSATLSDHSTFSVERVVWDSANDELDVEVRNESNNTANFTGITVTLTVLRGAGVGTSTATDARIDARIAAANLATDAELATLREDLTTRGQARDRDARDSAAANLRDIEQDRMDNAAARQVNHDLIAANTRDAAANTNARLAASPFAMIETEPPGFAGRTMPETFRIRLGNRVNPRVIRQIEILFGGTVVHTRAGNPALSVVIAAALSQQERTSVEANLTAQSTEVGLGIRYTWDDDGTTLTVNKSLPVNDDFYDAVEPGKFVVEVANKAAYDALTTKARNTWYYWTS